MITETPKPPYYAVIFTSKTSDDLAGYQEMSQQMLSLAAEQDGFLGIESAREEIGITVSYWRDLESIKQWKAHATHQIAQKLGKTRWYESFTTRIARVEREYSA